MLSAYFLVIIYRNFSTTKFLRCSVALLLHSQIDYPVGAKEFPRDGHASTSQASWYAHSLWEAVSVDTGCVVLADPVSETVFGSCSLSVTGISLLIWS